MTLETDEAVYDEGVAKILLETRGEEHTANAWNHMQKSNMITRYLSDTEKRAPGRPWKFQEWWVYTDRKVPKGYASKLTPCRRQEELLNGPIHPKIYRGAKAFDDSLRDDNEQDAQELPYVINDGTMAALLQLISNHKVCVQLRGKAAL